MGSKRVGLARLEALMENLKRELAMGGARFTAVKGVEMAAYSDEISADETGGFGDTSGIAIPANSLITEVGLVVTTQFTVSTTSTLGATFGTAAAGEQIVADDADSIRGSSSGTLAVGKGTSSNSAIATSLGGAAALVVVADSAFSAAARTIFGSVTINTGNITAGAVRFYVKYITLV
jgi:hypothetical protein